MYKHIRVRSEDRAGADIVVVVVLLLAKAVRDLESDKNLIFLHISHDVAKARSRVYHSNVSLLLSRCASITSLLLLPYTQGKRPQRQRTHNSKNSTNLRTKGREYTTRLRTQGKGSDVRFPTAGTI
jgi:hypothetical protein